MLLPDDFIDPPGAHAIRKRAHHVTADRFRFCEKIHTTSKSTQQPLRSLQLPRVGGALNP
jgi:hypothetical protein